MLDGYLETVYDIIDTASDLAKRQFPHCEPGAREPTTQSSLGLHSLRFITQPEHSTVMIS